MINSVEMSRDLNERAADIIAIIFDHIKYNNADIRVVVLSSYARILLHFTI